MFLASLDIKINDNFFLHDKESGLRRNWTPEPPLGSGYRI